MNVLMFTMTMILLLATMTYARLDSFRSLQITKTQFENHMEKTERQLISDRAKKWYDEIIVNSKSSNDPTKTKIARTGTSKLSWFILLNGDEREKDPFQLRQITDLSKKLILNLFTKDSNVQAMIQKDPDIVDRFFLSVMAASDKLPPKMKIKEAFQLSSLDLQEEDLKQFRYELFRDNPYPLATNTKDNIPKKETYSLLEQLTVKQGKTRVFLASKALLQAALDLNENMVLQIMDQRLHFYREVKNKHMENPEASAQFEAFIKELAPNLNENIFDFSVTKTNPAKFE